MGQTKPRTAAALPNTSVLPRSDPNTGGPKRFTEIDHFGKKKKRKKKKSRYFSNHMSNSINLNVFYLLLTNKSLFHS